VPIERTRWTSPSTRRHDALRRRGYEDGAIAIMTPFVLILMIAMLGMALDLSRGYNRKIELQNLADAVALAAAGALDGTPAGIDRAVTAAAQASGYNYSYNTEPISWSSAALAFGTDVNGGSGGWMDATTAKANASKTFFARIDTSALDPVHGTVDNYFMPILSSALATTNVSASAVAGRDSLNVLPLAICANSNTSAASLPPLGELVEFGFRRGVTYNLMNLNPGGRTPENFLVNPVAPPGTVGTSMMNRTDVVGPFVCTGKMAIPTLGGGDITVERGFPIGLLTDHLNSRFGPVTACQSSTAPADPNVKVFDLAAATWMKYTPDGQSANSLTTPDPLLTVAEKPAGATKTAYGPLWTYAKAVKYTSYVNNGGVEPATGYTTFNTTDWGTLYNPGGPTAQSYPSPTPYQSTGGGSTYKSYRNTRVLNIPLLRCPVPAGSSSTATVIGIAKFFMTVKASSSALYAEFAGMNTETALGGNARLYR